MLRHRKAKKSEFHGFPQAVGSVASGPESIGPAGVDDPFVDLIDLADDIAAGHRGAGQPEWRRDETLVDALVDAFKCLGWGLFSLSHAASQLPYGDGPVPH